MRRRVIFRPSALADLKSLYDYIEPRNPKDAARFVQRIEAHCMKLADFPNRGTRRDDLRAGMRVIGFERRVAIAFVVLADAVEISRILYAGRDIESSLEDEADRDADHLS